MPYGLISALSPATVPPPAARAEALELALRQRAEHHDAVGLAGDDRRGGIAHRGRTAAAAAAPLHVGEAQLLAPSAAASRDGSLRSLL